MDIINMFSDFEKEFVLPFTLKLDFNPVFKIWEDWANGPNEGLASYAKAFLSKMEQYPELRTPVDAAQDYAGLDEIIRELVSPVLATSLEENEIKALALPFSQFMFMPTARFKRIIDQSGHQNSIIPRGFSRDDFYMIACMFIITFHKRYDVNFKRPVFFDIPDANGRIRSYRVLWNADNTAFQPNEGFDLSDEDVHLLLDNYDNIELWREKIPPNSYTCKGFSIVTLLDVTDEELVSSLKSDLLGRASFEDEERFIKITKKVSDLFGLDNLRFGFAFADFKTKKFKSSGLLFSQSMLLGNSSEADMDEVICQFGKDKLLNNEVLALANVKKAIKHFEGYNELRNNGIKSYLMAPIMDHGELIGIFEIGSTETGALNSVVANKLLDLLPIFSVVLQRHIEEHENELDIVIQENCTSLHPTVAWRFREAAENFLKLKRETGEEKMEAISFPDVMPLFGQSDIKGSSTARNQAIKADLLEQLQLASEALNHCSGMGSIPIMDHLNFRIQKYKDSIENGLNAGDEMKVLGFLKSEIYPVFNHLKEENESFIIPIQKYKDSLDPTLGMVYKRRREFEETVSLINSTMGKYLDHQQNAAQSVFPHYFEAYKTDGVEYNMYIGKSLTRDKVYHPMYLRNLRLWQLFSTWGMENEIQKLKKDMPLDLDVASLILVHENPLAIKFRIDEKQFDVDGAYNIRYEIIKKRIDKAFVKGTGERLTQVGKLAIVYTQDNSVEEYRKYFEYLQSLNLFGEIEYLQLEDQSGVSGLKAIRVELIFNENQSVEDTDELIKELIKA